MLDSIRKRQRTLMIIISAVAIVSFIWVFNPSSKNGMGAPSFGKINGRQISRDEMQKLEQSLEFAARIGMVELPGMLATEGRNRDEQLFSAAWNLLVLREGARSLQIEPTNGQIAKAEKALEVFQANGHFDGSKYQTFVDGALKSNGLTAADLDQIVADNLRLKGISALIKPTAAFPVALFQKSYNDANGKMHLAAVQFKRSDFDPNLQISDAEIKKFYDAQKSSFQSPEQRKIEIVNFDLNDAQKKLPDDQKQIAMKPLADKASAFSQPALDHPDQFEALAQKQGLAIQTTGFFTESAPDPAISNRQEVIKQAFSITKENPVSDPIQTDSGFSIVKLAGLQPSHPLTLAEAHDKIVATLKEQRISGALEKRGTEARTKIVEAMKKGASFVEAAQQAGYKVEQPAPFSLRDPGKDNQYMQVIETNQLRLEPGETTPFLQDYAGGCILHLNSIDPVDPKAYQEALKTQYPMINERFAGAAFVEWLKVTAQKVGKPAFGNS